MTMTFAIPIVAFLSAIYAVALTTRYGILFADRYPWLAFSFGEMLVILLVALLGSVTAVELFLLNAAGAVPMVLRWAYLDIAHIARRNLRAIYERETKAVAGRSGAEAD